MTREAVCFGLIGLLFDFDNSCLHAPFVNKLNNGDRGAIEQQFGLEEQNWRGDRRDAQHNEQKGFDSVPHSRLGGIGCCMKEGGLNA